jgi:hypothetical protein
MHSVGFEPTISMMKRTEAVHALDGAATVIGPSVINVWKISKMLADIPWG